LLAGVAHAHAQGIIHRDLKPENFILGDTAGLADHVRILDFGLAKLRDGPAMTSGLAIGTPSYMSPEQTGAPGEIDGRTDIYAIGVVLFEMLAGRKPFVSDKVAEILLMHRDAPPPSLRQVVPGGEISRELEAVVHRALAKTPEARFQNAAEFAQTLDRVPEAAAARAGGAFPATVRNDAQAPVRAAALAAEGDRTIADPSPSHLLIDAADLVPDLPPEARAGSPVAAKTGDVIKASPGALGLSRGRWLGLGAVAVVALGLVAVGLWRRPRPPRPASPQAAATATTGSVAGRAAKSSARSEVNPGAGDKTAAATKAAGVSTEAAAPSSPPSTADRLANARELTAAGEWEQAMVVLQKARRENADSGEAAYELANLALEHKRWWEGAQAARAAGERDARYKSDARLVKSLIRSLASDKGYEKTEDVLHGFGAGATPFLKDAAAHDKSRTIRQRAAELLRSRDGGRTFSRPASVARKPTPSRSFFSR
ncbi:MAG: serine/threonine-protein kinase, partial [Bacteroidota bacterium]